MRLLASVGFDSPLIKPLAKNLDVASKSSFDLFKTTTASSIALL